MFANEFQELLKNISQKYDLSRGQPVLLEELFRIMFTSLLPFETISNLRDLCIESKKVDVRKCFQDVLQVMLQDTHKDHR